MARTEPEVAREASQAFTGDPDAEIRSLAELTLGIAARVEDDARSARAHLERAVEIADREDFVRLAAEARLSLVTVLVFAGDNEEALRQAERASPHLEGSDRARLGTRRALLLQRMGRFEEALDELRRACIEARQAGDLEGEGQALGNRGLLHAYQGHLRAAEKDLERAHQLFLASDDPVQAADALHNLGFVAARGGQLPSALEYLEAAERQRAAHGVARPVALLDRCEALLSARLATDARRLAEQAADELAKAGLHADEAEAHLLLAEAALLEGDAVAARAAGSEAEALFRNQGRGPWATVAAYAGLRARWAAGDREPGFAAAARGVAEELDRAGWATAALDARVMAAHIALDAGRTEEATRDLLVATRARRTGPAAMRARAWHAEALLRDSRGHRTGVWRALDAGMRAVHDVVATAGATELRVHAAGAGEPLTATALRLAMRDGNARRVLTWAERARAASLQMPRLRPPRDPVLARFLERLRFIASRIEQAGFAGTPDAALLREQTVLEQEVRRRAWQADPSAGAVAPLALAELSAALGERRLLELVELDGETWIVLCARGRVSLHRGADARELADEADSLRFSLARLARPGGLAASRSAADQSLRHAAARLDELLLGAVRRRLGDAPVVVVPTGRLHALPWGALPSLRGRPVEVCPSAALWMRCGSVRARSRPRGGVVLAAGPGLAHAGDEIARLADLYGRPDVIGDRDATAARVLHALGGARVAHLAAHGSFRADNPLFSSVRLADGPLTVYDLERLRRPPRLLVLSACDVGTSAGTPGDTVMGLAASLLAMGTATLVASVTTVDDARSPELMTAFHQRLIAGSSPAEALAAATAASGGEPTGFICLGAG